jgi:type I restriction-modification system DNA methylase subunit
MSILPHSHHLLRLHYHTFQKSLLKALQLNPEVFTYYLEKMKLGDYKDNTIDAFGDAYEFLMGMYAGNAGKSGGEYYTPQEISELLTRIALVGKSKVNKVYDPACGSGSARLCQGVSTRFCRNFQKKLHHSDKNKRCIM